MMMKNPQAREKWMIYLDWMIKLQLVDKDS